VTGIERESIPRMAAGDRSGSRSRPYRAMPRG